MKKIKSLLLGVLFLSLTLTQSGCIGSFKLTNNLYDWNKSLDGKALQEVVFFAFVIIPVYEVTLFIDGVILNSIEFWSGNNPMSMNNDEKEIQIVENRGQTFEITATQNQFHVVQLDGEKAGQFYDLKYNTEEAAWYIEANGISKKIATIDAENLGLELIKPNGEIIYIDPSITSRNAVKAAVSLELADINN